MMNRHKQSYYLSKLMRLIPMPLPFNVCNHMLVSCVYWILKGFLKALRGPVYITNGHGFLSV